MANLGRPMINTDPPETAPFADLLREYLTLTESRDDHSYGERQRYFALEAEMNRRCPPLPQLDTWRTEP